MMVNTPRKTRGVLALLLCLLVSAVWGDANPACDCGEVQTLHDKCVQDYWSVDEQRKILEEKVKTAETLCEGKAQQGELQAQLEKSHSELDEIRRLAKEEYEQFQAKNQELTAEVEKSGSEQRRLQESSHKMEEDLTQLKAAKKKLEKDLSTKEESLGKAKKTVKEARRELGETKKALEGMVASKTIITIDFDLLQERLQEIKEIIMAHINKGVDFMHEQFSFVKEKLVDFWKHLETNVVPEIVRFAEKEVIPFVEKSWNQAKDLWEQTYAPYRGPVNKQIKETTATVNKAYTEHLEPKVKEYKLDQHAAEAKSKAEELRALAHNELVKGIDSGTGIALNFVKLEEGPEFLIDGLQNLHSDPEKIAGYIETFLACILVYYVLKFFFGPRKPKKKKRTKQQWKEQQLADKQMKNKNGHNNGKNGKKKKV